MSLKAESGNSEINTVFGRCRCCLEYGYMKNMWVEHYSTGEREVYAEMLMDTFSIAWETESTKAHICESCIEKLRIASAFKKHILLSSEQLVNEDSDEFDMDDDESYKYSEGSDEGEYSDASGEPEEHYEQVEYLDEYLEEGIGDGSTQNTAPKTEEKTKWPRKKRRKETRKGYKNYTSAVMKQAIEAVTDQTLSISEAAAAFGVPRKTLTAKLYDLKNKKPETPESLARQSGQDKQYKFIEEIKRVLHYTTAVPFKIKTSRYYCAVCYTDVDCFENPEDLRGHTCLHDDEIQDHIERILRPQFQNEILRVDIEHFTCKVCNFTIPTWNDMFLHLNESHGEVFDEIYSRLIPYRLTSATKVHCALCLKEFPNFQFLDAHMNAHYCNYMCSECGDTYVTEVRLKHHELIHNTGKFPCRHCGKVFSLEKYKKKHEAMVHNEFKMFKCNDCGEQFHKEYERHQHIVKAHPERVRVNTCEFCGKTFDWRPYYLAHLRKAHSNFKKNACRYCHKRFVTKHEMQTHELRHTGGGKFVCLFCAKNFVTKIELRKHLAKHVKEVEVVTSDALKTEVLETEVTAES